LEDIDKFIIREEVQDKDIYSVLVGSIPKRFLRELKSRRGDLYDKPWEDIEEEVRQILEPTKHGMHYLQNLMQIRPSPGESMHDYHTRINALRQTIFRTQEVDGWFDVEMFINSLPS
jgi:hypothetical protein